MFLEYRSLQCLNDAASSRKSYHFLTLRIPLFTISGVELVGYTLILIT